MRSRATLKHPTTTEHKQMRNPGHKYTPRGKKMLRGVYFFCPIGMKGEVKRGARVLDQVELVVKVVQWVVQWSC
jgi:hypothetical protein